MEEDFDISTKAELAEELRCTKQMVNKLVNNGLPVRDDGKVNVLDAMRWIVRNVTPPWDGGGVYSEAKYWLRMFDRPRRSA
jgi:hypothetical protein